MQRVTELCLQNDKVILPIEFLVCFLCVCSSKACPACFDRRHFSSYSLLPLSTEEVLAKTLFCSSPKSRLTDSQN